MGLAMNNDAPIFRPYNALDSKLKLVEVIIDGCTVGIMDIATSMYPTFEPYEGYTLNIEQISKILDYLKDVVSDASRNAAKFGCNKSPQFRLE